MRHLLNDLSPITPEFVLSTFQILGSFIDYYSYCIAVIEHLNPKNTVFLLIHIKLIRGIHQLTLISTYFVPVAQVLDCDIREDWCDAQH